MLDKHFIFFPVKGLTETPQSQGLQFDDIFFCAADGTRLHAWFLSSDSDFTLLWFHGNAGNLSGHVDELGAMYRNLDLNILIVDYRGYGNSDGSPSEKGLYQDADSVVGYLRSRSDVDMTKLIVFGRSLGSAVAVETARRHGAYSLLLESPLTSIKEMVREVYPFFPGWILLRSRFDSLSKIAGLGIPTLILHGECDEIVPFHMGRKLFQTATGYKKFVVLENGLHNAPHLDNDTNYFNAIKGFLNGIPK